MPTLDIKARAGVELIYQDSNIWDRLSQDVYSFNRQIYSFVLSINF
jgi:hypothetical protein